MKKLLLTVLGLASMLGSHGEVLAIQDADSFALWTTIDANADGAPYQWAYNDGDAIYTENKKGAADDWLISPAITLKGGSTYKVSAYLRNATTYSSDKQKFTINAGTAPTTEALSGTVLLKNESLGKGAYYNNYDARFTPETDGEYYFAIHCYSASYQGNFMFQKFEIEEVAVHPGAVTSLTATAAPLGELKTELSWTWPSVSDQGGAYTGTMGAHIYRHTSATFPSDLATCLAGTVEGGQPGATATYTDAGMTEAGIYYYQVQTFDANGTSTAKAPTAQSAWVGKDSGVKGATNVTATVVDDHTVSLTFTPSAEGSNGGYVDPADIAYRITRKNGAGEQTILEEAWSGTLPYTDSSVEGLDSYTYSVTTVYQGTASWSSSSSNAVVLGGALTVPYSQDFSSSNHFFTFFHGADATRDWSVSSQRLNYWGRPADAWAVAPGIALEAGKAYELTFSTWVNRSSSPKDFYVYTGTQASAEGLGTQLFFETISSQYSAQKTVKISVAESGVYYIAFRCYGESDSNDIFVDDVELVEIAVAPEAVIDLTATPGEKGRLEATLTWTNPATDNTGAALTAPGRIEIVRGGTPVATIESFVPGAEASYTDATIENAGKYTYTVTAYLGENASDPASCETAWVGADTPKAVSNATATLSENGKSVTVSFEAPDAEGVNGGYVDTEALRYTVVRMPDDTEVAYGTNATTVTDNTADLGLGRYWYEISIAGYPEVETAATERLTIGDAITLPYEPDFSDAATFDIWTSVAAEGTGTWKYNTSNKTFEASFTSNNPWTFTPPFKAYKGEYKLVYRATCYNARYTEDIEVVLATEPTAGTEGKTVLDTREIDTVNYPGDITVEFEIPANGTYYIGYHCATDDNWRLALHQSNLYMTLNSSGVEDVAAKAGQLSYDRASATLYFDSDVTVYSADGTPAAAAKAEAGSLDLSGLARGIYIARSGQSAIKFVK